MGRRRITLEDLDIRRDGTIYYNGEPKKCWKTKDGYIRTKFSGKQHSAHRLVAQKYIPNPENKPQVNHINGVKDDNRVSNLEWNTAKENMVHAFETGLKGMSQLRRRKLTMEQAREIRSKYIPRKYTMRRLEKEYGLDYKTINQIIHNERYKENTNLIEC